MKKICLALLAALLFAPVAGISAQNKTKANLPEYSFTTVKANPITSVKNQYRSGTCWVFSTLGFVESEIIRINGIKDSLDFPDLSEFFVVSHSYLDRAEKYVRMDGHMGFSAGSEGGDVLDVIKMYGIVPQKEMTGMQYGTELPVQGELDAVLKAYVDAVVRNPNRTLTTAWKKGVKGVLDAYLGPWPEKFSVNGKEYTPEQYRDALKFNPDDYVCLTSFTHHPFDSWFALEVCDNWRGDLSFNIPIDELMEVIDSAINNGYTLEWGADVSHPGFTRNGLGVLVDMEASSLPGSDQEHWVGKEEGKPAPVVSVVETVPTQESRQIEYDNKTMTDDHGMQIFGIAKDQDGKKYYMVKNSWGDSSKYNGIWYVTEAFMKGQTLSIMLHKSALPKALRKKAGC
ncbi:MAG: aminopeptidase [Bacteroidales bacterium]|nr:aminopeptidase [Bacteroidales bacterium]